MKWLWLPIFVALFLYPHSLSAKEVLYRFKGEKTIHQADLSEAGISLWRASPWIEKIEEVKIRKILLEPDDTSYPWQWHLEKIGAASAWDKTTGSDKVIVAIIDSGAQIVHPDLADNIWINENEIANNSVDDDQNGYVDDVYGWDYMENDGNPTPVPNGIDDDNDGYVDFGVDHGTHVAGIVGAVGNNSLGVAGVNWQVKLMILKVTDDEGYGGTDAIISAVNYAIDNGADIINLSLGEYEPSAFEEEAIEAATDNNILVIGAVGNDNKNLDNDPIYPACYDKVLGIGATNRNDERAYFSNYGDCVDLAAPGVGILSTLYGLNYGNMSGTSMAAPMVAGAAALLKAYDSGFSRQELKETLKQTATDVNLENMGSGRLNLEASLFSLEDINPLEEKVTIKAYTTKKKNKKIKKKERTKDASPYFSWKKSDGQLLGYYLYLGSKKKGKPKKEGLFITKNHYQAKKIRGNEKKYYLNLKIVDIANNLSQTTSHYRYLLVDNKIKRPTLSLTQTSEGIKLTWLAQEDEHIVKYKIYRRPLGRKKFSLINETSHLEYLDQAALDYNKKGYRYKIRAIDDLGNKRYSKTVKVIIK